MKKKASKKRPTKGRPRMKDADKTVGISITIPKTLHDWMRARGNVSAQVTEWGIEKMAE